MKSNVMKNVKLFKAVALSFTMLIFWNVSQPVKAEGEKQCISEVSVSTTMGAPVVGETIPLNFTAQVQVPEGAHYSVRGASFFDSQAATIFGLFEDNRTYYMNIVLEADEGYEFKADKYTEKETSGIFKIYSALDKAEINGEAAVDSFIESSSIKTTTVRLLKEYKVGTPVTHPVKLNFNGHGHEDMVVEVPETYVNQPGIVSWAVLHNDDIIFPIEEGWHFDGWYLDSTFADGTKRLNLNGTSDNTAYYAKWRKIVDSVDISVEVPACGTVTDTPVITDGTGARHNDWDNQTNKPNVSITNGEGLAYNDARWVKRIPGGYLTGEPEPFKGVIKGDDDYSFGVILTKVGNEYYFANSLTAAVNDQEAKVGYDDTHYFIYSTVSVEHDWDNGTVTTKPTCEKKGVKTYTCSGCGDTKTEYIDALGHDWGDWAVTAPATEDTEGVETRACKNDATHIETRPIPKLPHVHTLLKTKAVAANCEADGNIEYWTCSGCGRYFSDSDGNTEINAEDTVIAALGHDWDEGVVTKEPAATEEGKKTYTCKRDSTHTRTETIPATGETPAQITYTFSAVQTDWTKESDVNAGFTVNRSEEDNKTFDLFEYIEIDGETVDAANYETVAGSLKLTLRAKFIETLSVGEHTLKAIFTDGEAETKLVVAAVATDDSSSEDDDSSDNSGKDNGNNQGKVSVSPKTGDDQKPTFFAILMFMSIACMSVVIRHRKKNN